MNWVSGQRARGEWAGKEGRDENEEGRKGKGRTDSHSDQHCATYTQWSESGPHTGHLGGLTFTAVQELENVLDDGILQHQHVLSLQVDNQSQIEHSSPVGCCGVPSGSHHVF